MTGRRGTEGRLMFGRAVAGLKTAALWPTTRTRSQIAPPTRRGTLAASAAASAVAGVAMLLLVGTLVGGAFGRGARDAAAGHTGGHGRDWRASQPTGPGAVKVDPHGPELLGVVEFPTGLDFRGTEVGGLSAVAYDPDADLYYALSDDRSSRGPARFYHVAIDVADGSLDPGDVVFRSVVTLTDSVGEPFPEGQIDPEGMALSPDGRLFISSEGDAGDAIAPWVREFSLTGRERDELPLPEHYLPVGADRGVRNNLALESLTLTPDGRSLLTGLENALLQDGPAASRAQGSPSRIVRFDLRQWESTDEVVYLVEPIPRPPSLPGGFADNGLVELVALDDTGTLLSLERSFAVGPGNTIRLFVGNASAALDVSGLQALTEADGTAVMPKHPVPKRLLADLGELGMNPDNVEGMTLGPTLADGRRLLILVSDNNFNPVQVTQFIALALPLEVWPAATPAAESPRLIGVPAEGKPAFWHSPVSETARLIAPRGAAGIVQYDLTGRALAAIPNIGVGEAAGIAVLTGMQGSSPLDAWLAVAQRDGTVGFVSARWQRPDFFGRGAFDPFPESDVPLGPIAGWVDADGNGHVLTSEVDGTLVAHLLIRTVPEFSVERIRVIEGPGDRPVQDLAAEPVSDAGPYDGYLLTTDQVYLFDKEPGVDGAVRPGGTLPSGAAGLAILPRTEDASLLLIANPDLGLIHAAEERDGLIEFVGAFGLLEGADTDQPQRIGGIAVVGGDLGAGFESGAFAVLDRHDPPSEVEKRAGAWQSRSWNYKIFPWSVELAGTPAATPGPTETPRPTATTSPPDGPVAVYLPRCLRDQ